MKNLFIVILLSATVLKNYGQQVFPYEKVHFYTINKSGENNYSKYKVNSISVVATNLKKNIQTGRTFLLLNPKARNIRFEVYKKQNKFKYAWGYKYLNDTLLLLAARISNKGDTTAKRIFVYNERGELIRRENFFGNMNRPKNYEHREYTGLHKISKDAFYYSNGKLAYRYEYDYYSDGQRKETRYYNRRNKLKYRYTYACDLKGELKKDDVKEINYCTKKELKPDGSFFEIFEYRDEKNRIRKSIYTYTKDSDMVEFENFNYKGKLLDKSTFTYDEAHLPVLTSHYNGKGKLYQAYMFTYNDAKLETRRVILNKKNAPVSESTYTYTYW